MVVATVEDAGDELVKVFKLGGRAAVPDLTTESILYQEKVCVLALKLGEMKKGQ